MLFSANSSLVSCSIETGETTRTCHGDNDTGHKSGAVISSVRLGANIGELVTSASDNRVVYWCLSSSEKEEVSPSWVSSRFIQLAADEQQQVVFDALAPSSSDQRELYLVVSAAWRHVETSAAAATSDVARPKPGSEKADFKLVLFDTKTSRVRRKICDLRRVSVVMRLFQTDCETNFRSDGLSHDDLRSTRRIGHEFIITASNRKLVSWSVSNKCGPHVVCPEKCGSITSLAVCSAADIVSTGHRTGEICLWYNITDWLLGRITMPVITRMHWHSARVMALSFAPAGNFLYSGGHEGVSKLSEL